MDSNQGVCDGDNGREDGVEGEPWGEDGVEGEPWTGSRLLAFII